MSLINMASKVDAPREQPVNGSEPRHNYWLSPGGAAFDFRGDVRTSPTPAMLEAITYASLLDDIDRSDPSTKKLEAHVAEMTGHEAALWVVSGTMGNLVALRALLTQPPYSILCDARAHCLTNEAGGVFAFAGAIPQPVQPSNDRYLTLEDIVPHVKLGEKVHACPTRVIALENTLRGMVMPLSEIRRISEFAHANGIKLHLDGARLWEAAVASGCSLQDFATLFDTATVCFSKGLGAPAGAMVVGSKAAIRQARWIRQSIGGSIRQPGLLAEAAYVAIRDTFGDGGSKLRRTHEVAKSIGQHWVACGGKLQYPVDTNMVWLDFEGQSFGLQELVARGKKRGITMHRDRLVIHYQISDEAVQILLGLMTELTK